MTARLIIVQPYVPAYRKKFFEGLRSTLFESDVECIVAAGKPALHQADRGDSIHPDWVVPLKNQSLVIKGRSINLGFDPKPWRYTNAVVLGLEGSSLPVYRALLSKYMSGVRVGLWGHVRPYVNPGNVLDLNLEKLQMRTADHVFAYTPGGRAYALNAGVREDKITTVMNSLDTTRLESAKSAITAEKIQEFSSKWKIDPSSTYCFIGGLDESKRIQFLADALDYIWAINRNVRFLIGGNGRQKPILAQAFARGQAIDLGYLGSSAKALVMASTRGLVMPGRIGLVAVDALVMRRPVLTTEWPFHAPESEYLIEGISRKTALNHPIAYANMILDHAATQSSSKAPNSAWKYPTVEDMIENFATGIKSMLFGVTS